jgi:hypothetical protein
MPALGRTRAKRETASEGEKGGTEFRDMDRSSLVTERPSRSPWDGRIAWLLRGERSPTEDKAVFRMRGFFRLTWAGRERSTRPASDAPLRPIPEDLDRDVASGMFAIAIEDLS